VWRKRLSAREEGCPFHVPDFTGSRASQHQPAIWDLHTGKKTNAEENELVSFPKEEQVDQEAENRSKVRQANNTNERESYCNVQEKKIYIGSRLIWSGVGRAVQGKLIRKGKKRRREVKMLLGN